MNILLESDRLLLRNYRLEDLQNVNKLLSEPSIWKYSSRTPSSDIGAARSHLQNIIRNYQEGKCDFQALFLKETQEYIGEAGILAFNHQCRRVVLGYNLLPAYWGNGYATEITRALIRHIFEDQEVERIEALVDERNSASRKVLEKSGLICEGLLRNFAFINNRHENVCYYGMIRSDYSKSS